MKQKRYLKKISVRIFNFLNKLFSHFIMCYVTKICNRNFQQFFSNHEKIVVTYAITNKTFLVR